MKKGSKQPGRNKQRGTRAAPATDGMEFEARRSQRLQTVALLKDARTPLTLLAVADSAASVAEASIKQAVARQPPRPPLACQEGCAWCCSKMVGTTIPEVLRIVAFLKQTLSAQEFQALQERVLRLDEQRRALQQDRWAAARLPCALLVDQRCSVYAVRPVTCRGFNSSDARQCERSLTQRSKIDIPMYVPQQRIATFVLDGMRAGLEEVHLKGELLELTAALRIALTVPDVVERWLSGEPVFAPARLP